MARQDFPRIIFTDDAWILNSDPPVTQADLRDKVVAGYAGTGGAFWWSTGDHEVYHFETRIGEIFGQPSSPPSKASTISTPSCTPPARTTPTRRSPPTSAP